jgi:hypothetical protein
MTMGWISQLFKQRPSDRITDARGDVALSPKDVAKFKGVSAECWPTKARQYINHNLENSPDGSFWIFEGTPVDVVKQIEQEYTDAGWIVTKNGDVMYFKRER